MATSYTAPEMIHWSNKYYMIHVEGMMKKTGNHDIRSIVSYPETAICLEVTKQLTSLWQERCFSRKSDYNNVSLTGLAR
jgi:hypothetical protein